MLADTQQYRPEILLVEDHEGARRVLSQLLSKSGFKVETADSVTEGLKHLDGQDFLILDMHLPDGLGLTILRKARCKSSQMKVAICSGSDAANLMQASESEHADRVFRKPLHFPELLDWLTGRA